MLFNRKSLINLMVPLILEQIFLGTIGIADMVMVAPVGETAISGISLVNSINMLFQSIGKAGRATLHCRMEGALATEASILIRRREPPDAL